jgi:23S rRNA (cytidine1920-2'-O)/16S rRNA (cytidine1409-2'-O)-methyltransferase
MTRQRADLALVERKIFATRAKAKEAIASGLVRVDGKILRKSSEPIDAKARIEASAPYPWVSRGGVKLAAALDRFGYDPMGRTCLDIGASTGGFSHVLLAYGAAKVVAVDVGHGQLHPSLLQEPRLRSLEGTDARSLTPAMLGTLPEVLTFDVSFIPLALVLPNVLRLAAQGARLVALIKPQFEAGPAHVKKGLVKDAGIREEVCMRIARLIEDLGWRAAEPIPSPIEGGDGNFEFLIGAERAC